MHMLDPDGNELNMFFQAIIRLGGIVQIVKCLPWKLGDPNSSLTSYINKNNDDNDNTGPAASACDPSDRNAELNPWGSMANQSSQSGKLLSQKIRWRKTMRDKWQQRVASKVVRTHKHTKKIKLLLLLILALLSYLHFPRHHTCLRELVCIDKHVHACSVCIHMHRLCWQCGEKSFGL